MAHGNFHQYRQMVRGANQFYQLLRCDCVNGYAVGRKRVHGKLIDDLCVGLLFAGSEASGNEPATTIVNPIRYVLGELDIEFLAPNTFPTRGSTRRRNGRSKIADRKS